MNEGPRPRRFAGRRLFPGWIMAGAGFLSMMLMVGSTTYSFGALIKPVAADLDISRGAVNVGLIIFQLAMGAMAPFMGYLFDRVSLRWMLLVCGVMFSAGFLSMALASSVWVIGAGIILIAFAAIGAGSMMGTTLASRWFRRRRGLVVSLTAMGASFGGLVVSPFMTLLIDGIGWRSALMVQGALVLLVLATLAVFVVRNWPADLGLMPDGEPAAVDVSGQGELRRWRFRDLAVEPAFWLIAGASGLVFGVEQAVLATLVPYGTDARYSVGQAASLVSMIAGAGMLGKLVFATIADRVDARHAMVAVAALNAAFAFVLIAKPSFPVLLAAALPAGLGVGATLPIWAALIGVRFGVGSFATVMGSMNIFTTMIQAILVYFVGASFSLFNNYTTAFQLFAASCGLAGVLILLVRVRPSMAASSRTVPVSG